MSMDLNGQVQNIFTRQYTENQKKKLEDIGLMKKDNTPAYDLTKLSVEDKYSLLKEFNEWIAIDDVVEFNGTNSFNNLNAKGKNSYISSDKREFAEFANIVNAVESKMDAETNALIAQKGPVGYFVDKFTSDDPASSKLTTSEQKAYDALTDEQKQNIGQACGARNSAKLVNDVVKRATDAAQARAAAAGAAQGEASAEAARNASLAATIKGLKEEIAGNEVTYFADKIKSGKSLTVAEKTVYDSLSADIKAEIQTKSVIQVPKVVAAPKPELVTIEVIKPSVVVAAPKPQIEVTNGVSTPVAGTIDGVKPSDAAYTQKLQSLASTISGATYANRKAVLDSLISLDPTALNNLKAYISSNNLSSANVENILAQATKSKDDATLTKIGTDIGNRAKGLGPYQTMNYVFSGQLDSLTYADRAAVEKAVGFDSSNTFFNGKEMQSFFKYTGPATQEDIFAEVKDTRNALKGVPNGVLFNNIDTATLDKALNAMEELNGSEGGAAYLKTLSSSQVTQIDDLCKKINENINALNGASFADSVSLVSSIQQNVITLSKIQDSIKNQVVDRDKLDDSAKTEIQGLRDILKNAPSISQESKDSLGLQLDQLQFWVEQAGDKMDRTAYNTLMSKLDAYLSISKQNTPAGGVTQNLMYNSTYYAGKAATALTTDVTALIKDFQAKLAPTMTATSTTSQDKADAVKYTDDLLSIIEKAPSLDAATKTALRQKIASLKDDIGDASAITPMQLKAIKDQLNQFTSISNQNTPAGGVTQNLMYNSTYYAGKAATALTTTLETLQEVLADSSIMTYDEAAKKLAEKKKAATPTPTTVNFYDTSFNGG